MMSTANMSPAEASRTHSLSSPISSPASGSSPGAARTLYPTDECITSLLASRSRQDLPYTRVGGSGTSYVVVNPLRLLESLGEESRTAYQRDVEGVDGRRDSREGERQPSVYDLAGRVWMLMARQKESQSIVYQ